MTRWLIAFSVAFVVCVGLPASIDAALVAIDGDLQEFGITGVSGDFVVAHASLNNLQPNSDLPGTQYVDDWDGVTGRTLSYVYEDSKDGDVPLGPNDGGQDYDAEYLGFFATQSDYWIGISTGQRRDNNHSGSRFGLGDIRLYFSDPDGVQHLIGVETGKGGSDGSREEGSLGRTYNLNGNGYTESISTPSQLAGDVLSNCNWILDPLPTQEKTQIASGHKLGVADYIYDYGSDLGEHAFIELSIDRSLFASNLTLTSVEWSPACGNDLLLITEPPHAPVPEPGSLAVWGLLSLIGGGYAWRRRCMTNAV